jgi:hypothetical protein
VPICVHLSSCLTLCLPFVCPCWCLCFPFHWIHHPRFQWLGHGPRVGPHRASALCNPIEPIDPLLSSAFHSLSTQLPVLCQLCPHMPACPKWVSPTIGTESAPVGVGVCRPGCPSHFVWERGTASGAFGPLGGILGQKATKKNNFGPKLLGQLFGPAVPPRGAPSGAQWSSWVHRSVGQMACGLPSRACPRQWF